MNTKRYHRLQQTEEGRETLRQWRQERYARQKEQGVSSIRGETPKSIVGIDGEGLTLESGEHRFVLLAASTGATITDTDGIKTEDAFRFLLSLYKTNRKIVGFALGYDLNQILKDLPVSCLEKLRTEKGCKWTGLHATYRMQWTPNKSFSLSSGNNVITPEGVKWEPERTITVWDVFGFYQSSFVKALTEWKIGTAEELAFISEMKLQRAEFDAEQMATIERYNALECKLLVELVEALEATLERANIQLSRWDGAGAIAGALLRKYRAKDHLPSGEIPEPAVMRAYFGGRIQALAIGKFDGPIYNYDVNSAYPAITCGLPSLIGEWKEVTRYDSSAQWALWEVDWSIPRGNNPCYPLTPFPWRDKGGHIIYPYSGCGFYWAPLVRVAKQAWTRYIRIRRGWVFHPDKDRSFPFEWVRDLYAIRKVYKREQDPRHIILKLGLNSLYGKFAQGVGYGNKKPTHQCYVWAGLITCTTQARLLEAALSNPAAMIAFATDGIFSRSPLEVTQSDVMGEWEGSECDTLFLVQPGLYAYRKGEKYYRKTRGFRPDELDFDTLIDGWKEKRYLHKQTISCRRFIGLKLALHLKRLHEWRRFVEAERVITCSPGSGFPIDPEDPEQLWLYWAPRDVEKGVYSHPYIPKQAFLDTDNERASAAAIELATLLDQPDPII